MKRVIDERLMEDESTYVEAFESLKKIAAKHGYKIIVSLEAEKEIDNAFEYYVEFSKSAGKSLINNFQIPTRTLS